jgi:CheY-like chemotaxis protein
MPSLDGLALCRLLKDIPIKKILLTGQKNGAEVVDAFNERIIDNFIRKDSPTLIDDLKKSVAALSTKYFAEQTKPLLMHLETQGQTPLSDKIFAEFFATWCKENDIQEYYLIEQTGSFLCIDSKNNQHYFVVHTEKSLKNIHHHYNELEIKIPDFLTTREKIPFFGSEKYFLPQDAKILATYFHPAKVLEGRGKYYWMVC